MNYLLHHIEPELFPEEPTDDAWFKGKELDLLCFALRVHQEALLPTETHDMDTTIPALSAVINQQYRAMGSPFAQEPFLNEPERLLEGYFPVSGKTITCALDTKADKTVVDFDYAEDIRVEKPLSVETDVEAAAAQLLRDQETELREMAGMPLRGVSFNQSRMHETIENAVPDESAVKLGLLAIGEMNETAQDAAVEARHRPVGRRPHQGPPGAPPQLRRRPPELHGRLRRRVPPRRRRVSGGAV